MQHASGAAHVQRKPNRKKKVVAMTLALMGISGVAFAYWTTSGAGDGGASAAATVSDVTVVQTSTVAGLAPGSGAHALSGTFNNPNTGPVMVGTLTATVDTVTKAVGAATGDCDADDFTVSAPAVLNVEADPDDTTTWSGLTISFNNKAGVNQDACKDATVTLAYSLS